jgi:hypothetical protein
MSRKNIQISSMEEINSKPLSANQLKTQESLSTEAEQGK